MFILIFMLKLNLQVRYGEYAILTVMPCNLSVKVLYYFLYLLKQLIQCLLLYIDDFIHVNKTVGYISQHMFSPLENRCVGNF